MSLQSPPTGISTPGISLKRSFESVDLAPAQAPAAKRSRSETFSGPAGLKARGGDSGPVGMAPRKALPAPAARHHGPASKASGLPHPSGMFSHHGGPGLLSSGALPGPAGHSHGASQASAHPASAEPLALMDVPDGADRDELPSAADASSDLPYGQPLALTNFSHWESPAEPPASQADAHQPKPAAGEPLALASVPHQDESANAPATSGEGSAAVPADAPQGHELALTPAPHEERPAEPPEAQPDVPEKKASAGETPPQVHVSHQQRPAVPSDAKAEVPAQSATFDPPLALTDAPGQESVEQQDAPAAQDNVPAQGKADPHQPAVPNPSHSKPDVASNEAPSAPPTPTPPKTAGAQSDSVPGDPAPPEDPPVKTSADTGAPLAHPPAVPGSHAHPGSAALGAAEMAEPSPPEEDLPEAIDITETIDVEVQAPGPISGPDAATQALIDKQLQQQANENALTEVRERIAENRARNEVANALAEARVEMWKKAAKAFKDGAG